MATETQKPLTELFSVSYCIKSHQFKSRLIEIVPYWKYMDPILPSTKVTFSLLLIHNQHRGSVK